MSLPNPRQTAFFLFLALFLQSCSAIDHQTAFEKHEAEYRAKAPHVVHHVERDGLTLYAREFGAANPGPALILMHGFPDNMHIYDWLVPLLDDRRHVITFDFIGWGSSDKPPRHRYDVSSLKADLDAVIQHFDLREVVLVMHDASGQPAIDWALEHPDRIAGLVLLNTYYAPSPTLKPPEAIALFSTPGIRRELAVFATRHWDWLWQKRYNEQMARFFDDAILRDAFIEIVGQQSFDMRPAFYGLNRVLQEEVRKRADNLARLRAFDKPVIIIFGKDDPYLNAGVAQDFDHLFPDSALFLIEGAKHFVQIEKPEKVAALIQDFPAIDAD